MCLFLQMLNGEIRHILQYVFYQKAELADRRERQVGKVCYQLWPTPLT